MTAAAPTPGDWDLTAYFPALDSSEYRDHCAAIDRDLAALTARVGDLGPLGAEWVDLLLELEDLEVRYGHLRSYLGCASSADARHAGLQAESGRLASRQAALESLWVAIDAAFSATKDPAFEQFLTDPRLDGAQHYLRERRAAAQDTMAPALEALAAELGTTGISAWWRLYQTVTGKMTFELAVPGQPTETRPVAQVNSLLGDPDPAVRKATHAGAAAAFEAHADIMAAALNAISGTRLTLYKRRGVDDFLSPALHDGAISKATLDALFDAIRQRQGVCHRYLAAKARALGADGMPWHDLQAPLPQAAEARVGWDQAVDIVQSAFAGYPKLGDFAAEAFAKRWIDHSPRAGKRPGGFCSTSHLTGESRIFMTFAGAGRDISTLAHELGHAFHSRVMRPQRSWSRRYPMTLAETASTFAEQLVIEQVLANPDAPRAARLAMLDRRLKDAVAFLVNIPMRFDFERQVYQERPAGELSVDRLCELMVEAQKANYGPGLTSFDPWFWASKLHFYISDVSFYNFPYAFGYLFSMGLFARIQAAGPEAYPGYENLLAMTGSGRAEDVARDCMGIELETPDFWLSSIDLIEADLARFEGLMSDG